jgi:hypothetical protein
MQTNDLVHQINPDLRALEIYLPNDHMMIYMDFIPSLIKMWGCTDFDFSVGCFGTCEIFFRDEMLVIQEDYFNTEVTLKEFQEIIDTYA